MATIYIDGVAYEAQVGENLLKAAIKLGIDIPYFCYHPALGSVGSCRLCAVKRFRDADDKKGRIVMSCMEPVSDGMLVSVNDEEVKNFRASIIESLMTNHPHDCPVCDEGGECHLQDMVVMTGHNYRRFEHKKRTYKNQDLGPYIHHEMNRCIQCYRCVRFYKDYAGGTDFGVFGAHNQLYFGRFEDGKLESPFSGNLVEVCPTGVFTDKTLKKHYTRKWDLTNAPSVCNGCAVGCNTIMGERYGMVRRVLNRYNKEVNGYFLCDRGRFGYEYINAESRIKKSLFNHKEIAAEEVVAVLVPMVTGKLIGIGSPNEPVEANYALQKLVGPENFFAGIASPEFLAIKKVVEVYQNTRVLSLSDIEQSEAVLVLGENILETAPRLALSVRQAVKNKPMAIAAGLSIPHWHSIAVKTAVGTAKGPLFLATTEKSGLEDIASVVFENNAEAIIRIGKCIVCAIKKTAFPNDAISEEIQLATAIVQNLAACKSVAIISGTQLHSPELIELAAEIASALASPERASGLYCVVPESNSLGLGVLTGQSVDDALQALENGQAETLIVLESQLYSRADKQKIDAALANCKNLVVLAHSKSDLTEKANIVLASATVAEGEGTLVSAEGRMQRYFSVLPAAGGVRQSWKWLSELFAAKNGEKNAIGFEQLINEIADKYMLLSKIVEVAPGSGFRVNGMKIPRQTPRFSGRTSMQANINVSEPKPPQDENSPLAYSMEGSNAVPPAQLTAFYHHPGWNSVQASNRYLRDLDNVVKAKGMGIRIFGE